MNKPKIAFYCSSLSYGGLEINIIRIVSWLKERGWDIVLFAQDASPMAKSAIKNSIEVIPVNRSSKYLDLKNAKKLSRLLKQKHVEILFVGTTKDISLIYLLKTFFLRKIRTVYHQQMQLGIKKRDLIHTLRFKKLDAWIAPLPYLAEEIKQKTRFNSKKIYVIPLCIDTSIFTNSTISKTEARKKLNLPENKFIIGILGRIDPHKRQDFLVRSLQLLNQKTTNIDLLIMGEPTRNESDEYYNFLLELIKECKVEEQVHLRPFSEDTIPFYKSIDIFVMATDSETFGMVTVEAMANGIPVIATNSGGSLEITGEGEYGLLFHPNDIAEFSNYVFSLYENKNFSNELGKKAKKQAVKEYDKSNECRLFEELIFKLTQSKSKNH